jgi:NADPH2:quinone reductase
VWRIAAQPARFSQESKKTLFEKSLAKTFGQSAKAIQPPSPLDLTIWIAELCDMTETMRYIDVVEPGAPSGMRIDEMPVPQPKPDEILIRVQAAGINRPDIQQRKGLYPPPQGASPVLGLEAAGIVSGIGSDVRGWSVGDKVTALCNGGAYAAYVTAPATQCLPWPDGFDAIQAAALPETFFTVWANVFDIGRLAAGESLLVHGGTSGIGIAAIQMAVARGSKVFATAGSAEKCAAIEKLGATGINYKETDFYETIATATNKAGVDVVLDMVGAPYTARNLRCLARDGRLVQVAFMQGSKIEALDLMPVMLKRLTITGSTMRPRTAAEKGVIAQALLREIWPLLAAKQITPLIDRVFPFDEVVAAHELMESSAHIGKIMLSLT